MPEHADPRASLRRTLLPVRERPARTVLFAAAVCLVCSAIVASTAVLLRPLQEQNRERERTQRMLAIVSAQPGLEGLVAELGARALRARIVDLASGNYADWIDPARFDARRAAQDPLASVGLPPEADPAGIGRRAKHALVYEALRDERVELLILPVHGQGYGGMLEGHVALAGDGNTVVGLSFHEHAETPGLGAEIDDPDWLAEWRGKQVRDGASNVRIGVAAGDVAPGSPDAAYFVDALTGATRTCRGVTNLLRFWLGEDGYGPFLRRFRP